MKKRKMLLLAVLAGSCIMASQAYAAGWRQDQNGYWYENDNGSYWINGWHWIGGKCYYFNESGYCLLNTVTPDGYQVDSTGAWIVDGVVQIQEEAPSRQSLEGLYGWHEEYGDAVLNITRQGDGYCVQGTTVQGMNYHMGDLKGHMTMINDTVGRIQLGDYRLTLIWATPDHIIVEEEGYPEYSDEQSDDFVSVGANVFFSGDYYYEGPPEAKESFWG